MDVHRVLANLRPGQGEPLALYRDIPKGKEFPAEALGPALGGMAPAVQSPLAICGTGMLASLTLSEPTIEGLTKHLKPGYPSADVFSRRKAIGGHAQRDMGLAAHHSELTELLQIIGIRPVSSRHPELRHAAERAAPARATPDELRLRFTHLLVRWLRYERVLTSS